MPGVRPCTQTHNVIDNGFMNNLNGTRPAGYVPGTYDRYGIGGTINIEAVHPYTQCFEGAVIEHGIYALI